MKGRWLGAISPLWGMTWAQLVMPTMLMAEIDVLARTEQSWLTLTVTTVLLLGPYFGSFYLQHRRRQRAQVR